MNIYEKLQSARVELQNCNIKKSGKNTHSNYTYHELGDFLPKINELCQKYNLFTCVHFDHDMAYLTITDAEKPQDVVKFTSPMAEAKLPACHPIQNMGAVQTYQRRYLYMAAFEIVEHDALDSSTKSAEKQSKQQPAKAQPAPAKEPPKKAPSKTEPINWGAFWAKVKELGFTEADAHFHAQADSIKGWSREQLAGLIAVLKGVREEIINAE